MNKLEIATVVALSLILLAWMYIAQQGQRQAPRRHGSRSEESQHVGSRDEPVPEEKKQATLESASAASETETESVTENDAEIETETEVPETTLEASDEEEKKLEQPRPELPEKEVTFETSAIRMTVSSWGGAIKCVDLTRYRESTDEDSPVLELDLRTLPALSLSGISGLTTNYDFEIERTVDREGLIIRRETDYGLLFERTIRSVDGYNFSVEDVLKNRSGATLDVPSYQVATGPMTPVETKAMTRMTYLGIDTLSEVGGENVIHWAKKGPEGNKASLTDRFRGGGASGGCAAFRGSPDEMLPRSIEVEIDDAADWIAPKNKFFVQILDPETETGGGFVVKAMRHVLDSEDPDIPDTWVGSAQLKKVYAAVKTHPLSLDSGEQITRKYTYYVGPKKFDILKSFNSQQKRIMEFGFFRPICELLLVVLNKINGLFHNYGIAIIILTVIVRVVFWPITHKSTESMKKMQKIQPLVSEIREKYKDKPQKMNQEVMALYKEHKVNPAAGCLPILVQIPVFIALFTMLRSAVELRFAGFLWISDLSEPERLLDFGFAIPIIGWDSLNILPLLMTAVTFAQQRLTPTAGDSQQQKMMAFMPVFLLVFFYNMPAGLILYWTTSQLIAVVQMGMQRRKAKEESP